MIKSFVAILILSLVSIFALPITGDAECLKAVIRKGKPSLKVVSEVKGRCPRGTVSMTAGPVGATGPTGSTGLQGLSGFDEIPAGTTVRGVFSETYSGADPQSVETYISLPGIAPQAVTAERVVVDLEALQEDSDGCNVADCLNSADSAAEIQSHCTGHVANPTADPGWVCIYPTYTWSTITHGTIEGVDAGTPLGLGQEGSKYGFGLSWHHPGGVPTYMRGVWAYTAPN